jgi:N-acetyl sugar amidotransferase
MNPMISKVEPDYVPSADNGDHSAYQICSQCIMDTTDPDIQFDSNGVCNHCHGFKLKLSSPLYTAAKEPGALSRLTSSIREAGKNKPYDCIVGVSGGVDSTYVAYLAKTNGLRPLAVHLDNGWNSELAVSNIQKVLDKLDIHLYTHVLDWAEFRDIQLSFLKASVPDCEIPTDHAILALLYSVAAKQGIKYILSGSNVATESCAVPAWSQGHSDWRYIRSVHQKCGTKKLRSYPYYNITKFAYYTLLKKLRWVPLLNYVDYQKQEAVDLLTKELGWRPYGGKHYESVYTRFYQGYVLPRKFRFDKRRGHLSSLVLAGQISRSEALEAMKVSDYSEDLQKEDYNFVLKKLELSAKEFEEILSAPPRSFYDFSSYKKTFYKYRFLINAYHKLKGLK